MSKKYRKRSVAIQSTDLFSSDNEGGHIRVTLKKKPGFRNLLQQSVIIASQKNEKDNAHSFAGEQRSGSVQAAIQTEFSYHTRRTGNQSLKSVTRLPSEGHSAATSRVINVIDRKKDPSNPGPSGIMSEGFSSISVVSQVNDVSREEGSLAVIYNYGERKPANSMTSAIFYGSQGSRRFSDETVLLIEDYQSYDQTNAAGRQEMRSDRRSIIHCCTKNSRFPSRKSNCFSGFQGRSREGCSADALAKPLPISFERLEEIVCRICHEGEEIEPLIQPCLCKGSVGCVHASCLKVWLEQSNTSRCELCKYPYAIRQTRKYTKCVSIRVFYKTVIDRRALIYDIISFVVITPLTLVAVAMCIQASIISPGSSASSESNYQIGYITKIGMAMLCGTIMVAYAVWLYTLISFHYKSWRKWYYNCYDVEVIPVRMTSEERIEASRRLNEELNRRNISREQGSMIVTLTE